MKQPGFFDVEERLARLTGLVLSSKHFVPTWIKLWPMQTAIKAVVHRLIRF